MDYHKAESFLVKKKNNTVILPFTSKFCYFGSRTPTPIKPKCNWILEDIDFIFKISVEKLISADPVARFKRSNSKLLKIN